MEGPQENPEALVAKIEELKQELAEYKQKANKKIHELQDELAKAAAGKGVSKKGMVEVTIDGQLAYVTKNAQSWMAAKNAQCSEMYQEVQRLQKYTKYLESQR